MTNFDELYELYTNSNEHLYDLLDKDNIHDLIDECHKNLAEYYEFQQFLYSTLDVILDCELEIDIANGLDFTR